MIYKINLEKKKEFEKWNYKQTLKHQLPIYVPGLILVDIFMFYTFPIKFYSIKEIIPIVILGVNLFFIPFYLLISFLGVKNGTKKLEDWELNVNENNATVNNSMAVVSVSFADFKKYTKDENSITFYLNGLRRFSINWDCYNNSEKLKSDLERIADRIGTFKKEELSAEEQKTVVKFKRKMTFIYILLGILLVLRMISFLL